MIKFVTTINQKLYTEYGRRALSEFDQFCGERVHMSLVFEGEIPEDIDFYKHISIQRAGSRARTDFMRRFGHLKELNGLEINYLNEDRSKLQISYNYRYNAIRFSHKIFSIFEEFERCKVEDHYLVWIDADIRVLKAFDDSALSKFLPESYQLASYLGRNSFPKPNPYSEGGWYGFNLKHPQMENFIRDLSELYTTGELFTLKEWHDCMAFDSIRTNYASEGGEFKNLSRGIEDLEHPFINCGLEEYFDHLKGPKRKKLGRSGDTDRFRRN